jgi:hypothetical protein
MNFYPKAFSLHPLDVWRRTGYSLTLKVPQAVHPQIVPLYALHPLC